RRHTRFSRDWSSDVCSSDLLFNLYKGLPMVKKGGTMIILHPCTDRFDNEHHAPYIEFVHRLLPETRDAMELHRVFEPQFAKNPRSEERRVGKGCRCGWSRAA